MGQLALVNRKRDHRRICRILLRFKHFSHLAYPCTEFERWCNNWRPHMTLNGLQPDDVYYGRKIERPNRDSKTVPCDIERRVFQETRFIGYRLPKVA